MSYVAESAASGRFVLTDCTVVDVVTGAATAHQDVEVAGGRIASIGAHDTRRGTDHAIDAAGSYVVPGYIDGHAHPLNHPDEVDGAYALMLAAGVTGYRQMSGSPALLRRRADGRLRAPLGAPELLALPGDLLTPLNASTPQAARATVRTEAEQGADFIKAAFTTRETLLPALDECARVGLPLDGHLPEDIDPREASAAGMRCMEHLGTGRAMYAASSPRGDEAFAEAPRSPRLPFGPRIGGLIGRLADPLVLKFVVNPSSRTSPETAETYRELDESFDEGRAEELAAVLRDNGTWQCATLIRVHTQQLPGEHVGDARARYIHPDDRRLWDEATQRFESQPAQTREDLARHWEAQLRMARVLDRTDVPMIAGTDASGAGWVIPGFALHDEFDLLAQAGIAPLRILQQATLHPARFFGRGDTAGQVRAGFDADLVVLGSDPTESHAALSDVRGVVRAGSYFGRRQLDDALARLESNPTAR